MKNNTLIIFLFFSCSLIISCENNTHKKKFYNVSFGTSRDELVAQFEQFDMIPDSTSKRNLVVYKQGNYDFGGFDWDEIKVSFSRDDKNDVISFYKKFDNPDDALKSFKKLKQSLPYYYNLQLEKNKEGTRTVPCSSQVCSYTLNYRA